MTDHVVILLIVTDPGGGGIPPYESRQYYESHDEAFQAYSRAKRAGFEARAEQVRYRVAEEVGISR